MHLKLKKLKNILTVNDLPLVSIDFNHNQSSSIFDLTQTQVVKGKFCRVLSWYDNEWGFSNRMIETMLDLKKLFSEQRKFLRLLSLINLQKLF